MRIRSTTFSTLALLAISLQGVTHASAQSAPVSVPAASQSGAFPFSWRQHEISRPQAPVVVPASQPNAPPSDAVVLFDGRDLSAWVGGQGNEAPKWKVENGYAEVVPRGGSIRTRDSFGDVQLHLEWAAPTTGTSTGQNHSNSGVILMGRYEIQILDSYQYTTTYVDGTAGAIYGQYPPLASPLLPPGQFQTEDIIFRRPRFRPDGSLAEPARATVLINGVLVQNNEVIYGPTAPEPPYQYTPHADALPFSLQDHGQAIRFRNIWLRRIPERAEPGASYVPRPASLTTAQLDRFVGAYYNVPATPAAPRPANAPPQAPAYTITRDADGVLVRLGNGPTVRAIAASPTQLWLPGRARNLTFTFDPSGRATQLLVEGNGEQATAAPRP
jgi:hypothetical protein